MTRLATPFPEEQQLLDLFQQALENQQLERLVLSQYKGELEQLEKMTLRVIQLNGQATLQCLYRHKTQDITKNYALDEAVTVVDHLLACCKQANLMTVVEETQLKKNKKKAMLTRSKKAQAAQANVKGLVAQWKRIRLRI